MAARICPPRETHRDQDTGRALTWSLRRCLHPGPWGRAALGIDEEAPPIEAAPQAPVKPPAGAPSLWRQAIPSETSSAGKGQPWVFAEPTHQPGWSSLSTEPSMRAGRTSTGPASNCPGPGDSTSHVAGGAAVGLWPRGAAQRPHGSEVGVDSGPLFSRGLEAGSPSPGVGETECGPAARSLLLVCRAGLALVWVSAWSQPPPSHTFLPGSV